VANVDDNNVAISVDSDLCHVDTVLIVVRTMLGSDY